MARVVHSVGRPPMWARGVLLAGSAILAFGLAGCGGKGEASDAERLKKISEIASRRPSGGSQTLVHALEDSNARVRVAALAAMTSYVSEETRPAIEQATTDAKPEVRASAATTLALFKDDSAANRLAEMLHDPNESVRVAAASSLKVVPTPKSIVLLLNAAESNDNAAAQERAMKSLLAHLGLRLHRKVDPRNGPEWRALVEEMKHSPKVVQSFAACGVSINYRPEDKTPYAPGHTQ